MKEQTKAQIRDEQEKKLLAYYEKLENLLTNRE